MEFTIGKISNSELTKELIEDIPGLNYHPNFLTDKHYQQILDVLEGIDYNIVNGRPTKYFGLDYTYRKKTHDSKQEEIPHFFNLLEPLGLNYDQLIIEYFRAEDGHTYIKESDLFDTNIIVLPIGSHFKYSFTDEHEQKTIDFLLEPKSLLVIGGESRKWKRSIRPRIKEKFNGLLIPRKEFYVLTYKNIKN